ncbi:MAG: type II methionyl aminopeptidase, partial [Candidatus Micrarchaeia archaeon]
VIEGWIEQEDAKPAFPVNLSVNEQAAHYTPMFGDEKVFGEKDVVKLDVGVSVDGFVGDSAITIDLSGEQGKLLEASRAALEAAVALMRPGRMTNEVGAAIEKEIVGRGFRPIDNLTGHMITQYQLHSGVEIPNIGKGAAQKIEEGQVFAVEPFATDGAGSVEEGEYVEIFALEGRAPVRMRESRRVIDFAEREYRGLPFAERWLRKSAFKSRILLETAFKELVMSGSLRQYPVLSEIKKGLVSQAEYTMVIEHDGARVLTK